MPLPTLTPSTSYWLGSALPLRLQTLQHYQSSPSLSSNVLQDVVIIGSGMTGASVAYHLLSKKRKRKQKIMVVEGRGLCSGATGRNGGILHAFGWNQWYLLYEKYGVRTATEMVSVHWSNLCFTYYQNNSFLLSILQTF